MIKIFSALVFSLFIITNAFAQNIGRNGIVFPTSSGVQKISLEGTWDFGEANGNLIPASSAPEAIDAKTKKIAGSFSASQRCSATAVPQFLNRIS